MTPAPQNAHTKDAVDLSDGPRQAAARGISRVLRVSVYLSLAVMCVGWLLDLSQIGRAARGPLSPASRTVLRPTELVRAACAGSGQAILTVGMILLMLSPVVRVTVAGLHYARVRNWPLALAALGVLLALWLSVKLAGLAA